MSTIEPFKSVIYNSEKIKDLSEVFCPPYDVISEEESDFLHNLNEYNLIHILLGNEKSSDDEKNNKYTRAKEAYDHWLAQDILVQDEKPAIYFYKQEYVIRGTKHYRKGFISLMGLQDQGDSKVFPHEKTHDHAVEDRFRLWSELSANLSSIFVCYSDKEKKVDAIFSKTSQSSAPIIDVEDRDGVRHILWRLDDPELIAEISATLKDQHLFIADGHHRYKVACQLRDEKLKGRAQVTGKEPENFVMTYFTNIDSKDLQIFPMHRIIKNMPEDISFLEEHFRIDKVGKIEDLSILLAKAGKNEHAFGLYTKSGIKLLRLKNKLLIESQVKEGSKEFKSLDATILKSFVFDQIGIKPEDIVYTKDLSRTVDMVDNGEAQASFIMNAVKISELKAIALNGERMPQKTTYFYPKVLSGLTVYKMD